MTHGIDSVGYIDVVSEDRGMVSIEGWVATLQGPPVDGFSVAVAGREVPCVARVGLPSPDVAQVHPRLAAPERCRFRIEVAVDSLRGIAAWDVLVRAQPLVGERAARALYHVLRPSLARPPEGYLQAVGGGFNAGFEFLGHLIHEADLAPTSAVLDVGCGTGRIAYALAYYLAPTTPYVGFDVVEEMVAWARQVITPAFPNFSFQRLDVSNGAYNQEGTIEGASVVFPCETASVDVAFLTSVFTHMRERDIRRYLEELRRVLKADGRCLFTCFALDEATRQGVASGRGLLRLVPVGDAFTTNPGLPEEAVGFTAESFHDWITEAGLKARRFLPGWWSGRSDYLTYQDVFVVSPA